MKVETMIKKIGLNWKQFKADFPGFGVEEILMMLVGAKVQLIGFLVLVFFPSHPQLLEFLPQLDHNAWVICLKGESLADTVAPHFLKLHDFYGFYNYSITLGTCSQD